MRPTPQTSADEPKLKFPKLPPDDVLLSEAKKPKKPSVRIKFSSSEQGSRFFCRFARLGYSPSTPYEPCAAPFKSRVRKGKRYQFDVVAVDGAGNPDPDPATVTFKAVDKEKKDPKK